jgi:ribosomal RNA methyltransferase Nop2
MSNDQDLSDQDQDMGSQSQLSGEEEGEFDLDDELAAGSSEGNESGEEEQDELEAKMIAAKNALKPPTEGDSDIDEDAVDDDAIGTNIDHKQDQLIKTMMAREDLGIIQMRIKETIRILCNFKELRDGTRSRTEYMDQLKGDISASYDYNLDLLDLLLDLFSPQECLDFVEANE